MVANPLPYNNAERTARNLIQQGDLLLFRDVDRGFAPLIRYVTNSPYSHVGMALWIYGRLYIIEALRNGVILHRLSWRLSHLQGNIDVYRVSSVDGHKANLLAICAMGYVDYKYDWRALIHVWANRVLGTRIANTPNTVICSEFIDRVYRSTMDYKFGTLVSDGTTPADIANRSEYQLTIHI